MNGVTVDSIRMNTVAMTIMTQIMIQETHVMVAELCMTVVVMNMIFPGSFMRKSIVYGQTVKISSYLTLNIIFSLQTGSLRRRNCKHGN